MEEASRGEYDGVCGSARAGNITRSYGVDGVAKSLRKSKKDLLPMAVLNPEFAGGIVVAYLADGQMKLPEIAAIFNAGDEEVRDGAGARAIPTDAPTRTVLAPNAPSTSQP